MSCLEKLQTLVLGPKQAVPLPKARLLVIALNLMGLSIAATSVFSFAGFMVVDFGLAKNDRDAGLYAGYIAGAYWGGTIFGSVFFGWLSDHIGRRPVLLGVTFATAVFTLAFGFSPNLGWAVTLRVVGGFFAPNFIIAKAYITDICHPSNRSSAFSVLALGFGLGALIGPLFGGLLARPAKKHPETFPIEGLFGKFPYALQGMVIAVLVMLSLVTAYFWLPESKNWDSNKESDEMDQVALMDMDQLKEQEEIGDQLKEQEEEQEQEEDVEEEEKHFESTLSDFERKKLVAITVSTYTLLSLLTSGRDESVPLFFMADVEHGGLGMNSDQIGMVLSAKGITIIFSQISYVIVARRFGALAAFKIGCLIYGPALLLFKLCNVFARSSPALMYPMAIILLTLNASDVYCFTSVNVMMNTVAPLALTGRINGIAGAAASIARTVGPMLIAPLFAWSANASLPWPADASLMFNISFVLCMCMFAIAFTIPKQIG